MEWLERNAPGFRDLTTEDRSCILQFALLWSFFEAKALQARASAQAIRRLAGEWEAQGRIRPSDFAASLLYFRERYSSGGHETIAFARLKLRSRDYPSLVRGVLEGTNNQSADSVAALLIVVYRLRNNLFHGEKWAYEMKDQRSNFEQANEVLMKAMAYVA
jgi:hypothetical protein